MPNGVDYAHALEVMPNYLTYGMAQTFALGHAILRAWCYANARWSARPTKKHACSWSSIPIPSACQATVYEGRPQTLYELLPFAKS